MSVENKHLLVLSDYIKNFPYTEKFFQDNLQLMSRFVYYRENPYSPENEQKLPWLCFENASVNPSYDDKMILVDLFKKLVMATKLDNRKLIIEIGSANAISPLQTASFFQETTIISLDNLTTPNSNYSYIKKTEIPKAENGSLVVSFQFSTVTIPSENRQTINANRVQTIALGDEWLLNNGLIVDFAQMVGDGGDLVAVLEFVRDIKFLSGILKSLLNGFSIEINNLSLRQINNLYGFNDSRYIQTRSESNLTTVIHAMK